MFRIQNSYEYFYPLLRLHIEEKTHHNHLYRNQTIRRYIVSEMNCKCISYMNYHGKLDKVSFLLSELLLSFYIYNNIILKRNKVLPLVSIDTTCFNYDRYLCFLCLLCIIYTWRIKQCINIWLISLYRL